MPRRKQDYPKKHDGGGTNSAMGEEMTASNDDQQEPNILSDSKSSTPSNDQSNMIKIEEESMEKNDEKIESALDLSIRKRSRTNESDSNTSKRSCDHPVTPKPSNETSTFSPKLPFNLSVDNFLSGVSTTQSTTPYVPLYVPPFRFPSFPPPPACPSISSPPSTSRNTNQNGESNLDALSKLSSLVHQVGKGQKPNTVSVGGSMSTKTNDDQTSPTNGDHATSSSLQEALGAAAGHGLSFQELWLRFVKKEENAELKRLNEAKQIFTCLQCHASFQTMEQLVKHMETTQHYANIPKHYSWSLQYARQRMRQMKMKMKYSDKMMYYCFLCTSPFSEPVHIHFNCVHNMHNPVENMKFVHVISVNGKTTVRTPSSTSSSSAVLQRRLGATAATSPSNHHDERRRLESNDDEVRFSSSPLSVGASSCESGGSASPTPSTSSKRSATNCPLATSFSPPNMMHTIDGGQNIVTNNNTGASNSYTDNLLLKMEKLVQTASGEKNEQKRGLNSDLTDMNL